MQAIVSDFKGQFSEVEIVKEMMREGELMLATCNVRYGLFSAVMRIEIC